MSSLQHTMVPRQDFDDLAARVDFFEESNSDPGTRNAKSFDLRRLCAQMDAIDPSSKQAAVIGFSDQDAKKRLETLERNTSALRECPKVISTQNIFRGKPGERKISRVPLVSFASHGEREKTLKCLEAAHLENSTGRALACKRALSFSFPERNKALLRPSGLQKILAGRIMQSNPLM